MSFQIKPYFYLFLVFFLWLVNPWLGLFTCSIPFVFQSQFKSLTLPVVAILTGLTISLYQLSLPMPSDLVHTKTIYLYITSAPEWSSLWMARDPLSYGTLNFLSLVFPGQAITFYIISTLINFICLWCIFKKESQNLQNRELALALLFAIFLGVLDYELSHHYIRQTTAIMMFLAAIQLAGLKKVILIAISLLWHGSIIILVPYLLVQRFLKKDKMVLITFFILLLIGFLLSQVNIYEALMDPSLKDRSYHDFTYVDRFLTYFQESRHAKYHGLSLALGNPVVYFYTAVSLATVIYAFIKREIQSPYTTLTMILSFYIVLFSHHVLIFPRLTYIADIVLLLYWSTQIQYIPFRKLNMAPLSIFIICLFKIHLFLWPIDTQLAGKLIFLEPTVKILSEYNTWPINLDRK